MGYDIFMIFSFFDQRFFVKNLWKFISQMGNPLGVYGTNYKVKYVKNLLLGKIWPPSDLLFLQWSYCISLQWNTNSRKLFHNIVWLTNSTVDSTQSCLFYLIKYLFRKYIVQHYISQDIIQTLAYFRSCKVPQYLF